MTPLHRQVAWLESLADNELGGIADPEIHDIIATLKLIAEFPDDVREAIRQAKERKRALQEAGPVVDAVMQAFPVTSVSVVDA
jgi:hypothetical protein